MAGTEYFGETAVQPRDHIPVNTMRKSLTQSHTFAALIRLSTILSRLTQAKYHRITRKNSAYWQINTTGLFTYTRLIQVPGCSATWTADQRRARFIPELAQVKVHLQFCSHLIHLTPKSLFPRPKPSDHFGKVRNIVPFCRSPDQGLAK